MFVYTLKLNTNLSHHHALEIRASFKIGLRPIPHFLYEISKTSIVRLMVRTQAFHACGTGSTPVRCIDRHVIKLSKINKNFKKGYETKTRFVQIGNAKWHLKTSLKSTSSELQNFQSQQG